MSSISAKKNTEQKLKENVEELEDLLKRISIKIENAAVLNGGFDELREEIREIKANQVKSSIDLIKLQEELPQIKREVSTVKDSIYHPDEGLYARLKESNSDSKRREEILNAVSDKATSIEKKIESIEEKITPIEETTKMLKQITGDDLAQLRNITNTKSIIDKIWWAILLAAAGGLGKFIWDLVPHIF